MIYFKYIKFCDSTKDSHKRFCFGRLAPIVENSLMYFARNFLLLVVSQLFEDGGNQIQLQMLVKITYSTIKPKNYNWTTVLFIHYFQVKKKKLYNLHQRPDLNI